MKIFHPTDFLFEQKTKSFHSIVPSILKNKTAQSMLLFALLILIPVVVPSLSRFRIFMPASPIDLKWLRRVEPAQPQPAPSQAVSEPTETVAASPSVIVAFTPGNIEDRSGHALDHFLDALSKAETGNTQVRISHYGDSPITNDGITSTVRAKLQSKFGDAGHGFILITKPWGWYGHIGVKQESSVGWDSSPMFITRGDHLFGFGGASFTTSKTGTIASFSTADSGEVNRKVSSFDIYFLSQPGGGEFLVQVDGETSTTISTADSVVHSDFRQIKMNEGPHTVIIKAVGNGEIRLFGAVLGTDEKGIQYDSLGVNGAYVGLLAHYMDVDHWIEQLRHRNPDLVILNYGTNESQFETLRMDQYEADTKEVIRRIRQALPGVSIMLVSPMDRGTRGPGGTIVTRPMIPKLVAYQRRIAAETGCAFFDTYSAMGGEGTVAKWYEARPRLMGGDFTHPTWQGSEIVGNLISDAIINYFEDYKARLSSASQQQATNNRPTESKAEQRR